MSEETVMTPITPEEGGSEPPKVAPAAIASATSPTVKLKPIIRKPMIHKPVIGGAKPVTLKPAAGTPPPPASVPEEAAEKAKKITSTLKAVTGPIPAPAVLRKTGIVAEGLLTPAQMQAAKTKTSRISLESAIGVAPVSKSSAPMKTIRLRRPTDIPPAPGATPAAAPAAPASVTVAATTPSISSAPTVSTPAPKLSATVTAPSEATTVAAVAPADATPKSVEPSVSVTQKKTLKLQRPGFKRPTVSGLRKPGSISTTAASAPVSETPTAATIPATPSDGVADMAPVADIPDLKPIPEMPFSDSGKATVAGVPSWLNATTLVAGLAALIVVGLCTWTLFREACGPAAGPNDLASFQTETDYRR